MKKLLFLISMLCSMTTAWAGDGDGSKENPFRGEWTVKELWDAIHHLGYYMAYDCKITGGTISVFDDVLDKQVAKDKTSWRVGEDAIGSSPLSDYSNYCAYNTLDERKSQLFYLYALNLNNESELIMEGYYTGFYGQPDDRGFIQINTPKQFKVALGLNDHAKIRLAQDIYLSNDVRGTFCSTFYGVIDGDGHTIYGSNDGTRQDRNYLFTYSNGATFKNLTFKDLYKNSDEHYNQAIITSTARGGCIFENITFDNVSTYSKEDNVGAATGDAEYCIFRNITVKNSKFTADGDQSGAVVGHAKHCEFTDIRVENCESAADDEKSGGVAGRSDNCEFENVEVLGTFCKTNGLYAGGVAGYSTNSEFRNCTTDDQSCVCVDGSSNLGEAGGIVGYSKGDEFHNCINSALITSDEECAGGIVGWADNSIIENCLNTGMVIAMKMSKVTNGFYLNYMTKRDMNPITKTYQGKEYVIRRCNEEYESHSEFGGIVGWLNGGSISKCVNLGSVYSHTYNGINGKRFESVGGIAGSVQASISDCLSDFTGSDEAKGLCGEVDNGSTFKHCLNMTTYKDFLVSNRYSNVSSDGTSYTLATLTDVYYSSFTEAATASGLKSGWVCHELGANWEQNIGTDPYPTPTGNKGLYYTRMISNQYGTVCLPFPVKSNDKISYYTLNDEKYEGKNTDLVFKYEEELIEEGTPVLFRAVEATDANSDAPIVVCFNNAGNDYTNQPGEYNAINAPYWLMDGTLMSEVVIDTNTYPTSDCIYYVSNGEIRNAKKVTIPPYHAYIWGPSIYELTAEGKTITFSLEDEDGTVTALRYDIENLNPMHNAEFIMHNYYNLNGQRVNANHKGIVIHNGKKTLSPALPR